MLKNRRKTTFSKCAKLIQSLSTVALTVNNKWTEMTLKLTFMSVKIAKFDQFRWICSVVLYIILKNP